MSVHFVGFQRVAVAGQKDARNERPYIFFAGFQGVTLAGQKDVQNVRPYIFAGFQGVMVFWIRF